MNKNIAQIMNIKSPLSPLVMKNEVKENGYSNYILHYEEQIVAIRAKEIDDFCLEQLYKAYENTPVNKMFVIDMTQFEDFLRRYLPVYLKENK